MSGVCDTAGDDDVFLDSSFQLARNVPFLKSSLVAEATGGDAGVKILSPDAAEPVGGHLNVKLSRLSTLDVKDRYRHFEHYCSYKEMTEPKKKLALFEVLLGIG